MRITKKKKQLIIKYLFYIIVFLIIVPYGLSKSLFPNFLYFCEINMKNIKEYKYEGIKYPIVKDKEIDDTISEENSILSSFLTILSGYDIRPNEYYLLFTDEEQKNSDFYLCKSEWENVVTGTEYRKGVVKFKINNSAKYCSIEDAEYVLGNNITNNNSDNAIKIFKYQIWKNVYKLNVYAVTVYYLFGFSIFYRMYKKDHIKKKIVRTN